MAPKYGEILTNLEKLMEQNKGASFILTELHCHTPGSSNDYQACGKLFESVSLDDLEAEAYKLGLSNEKSSLKDFLIEHGINSEQEHKECIIAGIIVASAYKRNVKMLVITDHNNVAWYPKLCDAICFVMARLKVDYKILILPGVEITAYSAFHVIAIVEPEKYYELQKYMAHVEYLNAISKPVNIYSIINDIALDLKGIVYFPHVDENKTFNKTDIRQTIIANDNVLAIAIKDEQKEKEIIKLIAAGKFNRSGKLAFVQDSDAHCPDDIGLNPIWLKMTRPEYLGLKYAFTDPDMRVAKMPPPEIKHPYILGMAFLDSPIGRSKKEWYYIRFNEALNCFIGSRGTGKSTIINWMVNALEQSLDEKQQYDEYDQRSWYSKFGRILLFLQCEQEKYVMDINPKRPAVYPIEGKRPNDISSWIEVMHIDSCGKIVKVRDKESVLSKFRTETFKQTAIETLAKNPQELHKLFLLFLHKDMQRGTKIEQHERKLVAIREQLHKVGYEIGRNNQNNSIDHFKRIYLSMVEELNQLLTIEKGFAQQLNNTVLTNKLQIHVEHSVISPSDLQKAVDFIETSQRMASIRKHAKDHIVAGARHLFRHKGIHAGIIDLFSFDLQRIQEEKFLEPYLPAQAMIESGAKSYSTSEIMRILIECFSQDEKKEQIANLLMMTPQSSTKFFHNVLFGQQLNSKEPIYKILHELSLGQQCVAILTFVIETAEFVGDNRPLIIDQPEDHLDNRYIYDYLVQDIRRIKERRQILLSTHNPNIPVCADAEQILVMASDGVKMWMEQIGSLDYKTDNETMILRIQEILEGGKAAFDQRKRKYSL